MEKLKKIVSFARFREMVRIFFRILFICVWITSCGGGSEPIVGDVLLFPENTQVIYRINHKKAFLKNIETNEFWKENNPKPLRNYETKLINSLPSEHNIWVAFTAYKNFFAITKKDENDSLSIWKNANKTLQKQQQFGKDWYYTVIDNRLIISNSAEINNFFKEPENQTKKTDNQEVLEQLQRVSTTTCNANLFMKKEQANLFFNSFFKTNVTKNFSQWLSLDLFLEENDIQISGMSVIQNFGNQSDRLINTEPFENKITQAIPAHILGMTSFTFENADKISLPNDMYVSFQKSLNGIAFVKTIDGQIAVASSFDTDKTLLQLPILSELPQNEHPLYELNEDSSLDFFKNFGEDFKPKYVSVYDDFLIFSKTKEILTTVMNDISRKNTLANNKSYELLEKNIASKVTATHVINLYDNATFSSKFPKIASNYRWAVFQQTPQNEYYMFHFSSKKQNQTSIAEKMKERFCFSADANFQIPPTILLNHRTKRREIAIQDENNYLYLIGNNGSLLWKKRLDGKIQSPIYQVDIFKNEFLQMVFTTENSIWVIDRNGNEVSPFPKKFSGKITPLEVFDYDKTKEYRFVFAEGKNIIMLDKKGEKVNGFAGKTTDTPLFSPKHFRVDDKDFLAYMGDGGRFNILHRNGQVRIPINEKFNFSYNSPIFFDNRFLFSNKEGDIVRIDLNGKVSYTKRNLVSDHYLIGNSFTTSYLSDRTLSIGTKLIEMPRGTYDRQKLFRIRGVNYVSAYNWDKNEVYLWNEKGNLIQGFPLKSRNQIDIDVDLDKTIWIAVASGKKNVCVYETRDLN